MANPDFCVIQAESGDIFFTVTESYNISRSASVTEYNIESGQKISDHHTSDNKYFKFSGVITLAPVIGGGYTFDTTPDNVITQLDGLIESGEFFTFLSDSLLLGSTSLTKDCVLTNYDVNRDSSMKDGLEVSVDIRQIQTVGKVEVTEKPVREFQDRAEPESRNGKQTTSEDEDINNIDRSLRESINNRNNFDFGG